MSRSLPVIVACCVLVGWIPAVAQDTSMQSTDAWSFDPAALAGGGSDLVLRAPDASIDRLFQALQASAQLPTESRALCALFDPDADRSLAGLNAAVMQLGDDSRERFVGALTEVLIAGAQQPRQPYDRPAARQSLKAAGVTAAILHDGFIAGLNGEGSEPAVRDARCRSLRWLLEAVQAQPLAERAAVTRYLLTEGLATLALD